MPKTTIRDSQFRENRTYATYTTNTNLTANIPGDDTVPQQTEGTEILSVSITPQSTSSRLRITFRGFGASSTNNAELICALFQDAVANALTGVAVTAGDGGTLSAANIMQPLLLIHEFVPGSLVATTLKVRVGANTGTMRMNGTAAARRFGGVAFASLLVEEILV